MSIGLRNVLSITANGLRHAAGPVQPSVRYKYSGTYPETTTGTDREPTVYNLDSNNGKIKKRKKEM